MAYVCVPVRVCGWYHMYMRMVSKSSIIIVLELVSPFISCSVCFIKLGAAMFCAYVFTTVTFS